MKFLKFFFKVNICLGCVLVSNNSQINLEEDDEIKQMIKEYVKSKNFLKKNVPLIIRLLESNFSYVSIDEINSIVNQLNINFKKEQINSKEYLDKKECIRDFKKYIHITCNKMLKRFGKLIMMKVKNIDQVKLDSFRCLSFLSKKCIYEFLDSLNENQKDIKLSNGESLLEIYMDFLSMHIFFNEVIQCYFIFRRLIIPIIEVRKKMLSSRIFNNKNVIHSYKFNEKFLHKIHNSFYEKVLYTFPRSIASIMNIEDKEKIKNFLKEFSSYIVEIIILIEKYNYYNKSLISFTIDSCIFNGIDNNDDDLKKEIQQLNIKLSNLLFIESINYNIKLNYDIKKYHFENINLHIPFSYLRKNYSVLGNYIDQDIIEDDVMNISIRLMWDYHIILLVFVNPTLTKYLIY
ncbi:hypothetical protein A0H76_2697 [Hepatospora eriocheir]|uniref:Uncharacterized protein n=1 Tax=Hepatospora eriocheir TaxID=1081669 RepID=A0A1X0QLG7_9MICR|nr:hypothetical protein A0H76_2697 [Hepatospora eriocheir]